MLNDGTFMILGAYALSAFFVGLLAPPKRLVRLLLGLLTLAVFSILFWRLV